MHLISAASPEYEEYRSLFNRMIDRRPARIALVDTPQDVADALATAQADALPVAVRAGGHSVSGQSSIDDGLVVDVRPMKRISIDPTRQLATVGAGVTWGELDRATAPHGLVLTGGRATSTGVAGFTLGGGDGWLSRSFGLACDSLVGAEMVSVDGRVVRADETQNEELLWGLRGGGGNFGVVTELRLRLHRMDPEPLCGVLVWPLAAARDVIGAFCDLMPTAPRQLGGGVLVTTSDPDDEDLPEALRGEPVVIVALVWVGPTGEGRDVIRPLLELSPDVDDVRQQSYVGMQEALTDPPGFCHYWSADYHDDMPTEAIDIFVESAEQRTSPLTQQVLFAWGGAVTDATEATSPLGHRHTPWVTHPFAVWEDPAEAPTHIAWAREFRTAIADHSNGGVYLNFVGNEGQDRVRAAFGEQSYRRLSQLKATWDPLNLLRGNQNIHPSPAGAA
jgi:FAD/FMN-containing dehydrogenase